ncbi:MAG: hypothetical protein AAF959_24725 [Cyanobacteria bacterium P01_D01_bin.56]
MTFTKIGFLGGFRFEDGASTRGAMLVTDHDLKPAEFRVTAPVKPNSLQKMLYGELLDEHIYIKLLGVPLLNALEQKPDVVIVSENIFLGLNQEQGIPTVCLLNEEESLIPKGVPNKTITSETQNYPSVKVSISNNLTKQLEDISSELQVIFRSRNLMEPFYRLHKACTDLHASGKAQV